MLKLTSCVIFLLFLGSKLFAGQDLESEIRKLVQKSGINKKELGILILDPSKKKVFGLNEDSLFTPASITKIITSIAGLRVFLPQHQFVTEILSETNVEKGVLRGDIYFKGFGDPNFVSEKMWLLVNELVRTGVKEIDGDIVSDDTYFDDQRIDPERGENDEERAYSSPIGALSFNWNSITIYVRPGDQLKDPGLVWIDTPNEVVSVVNKVLTTGGSTTEISVEKRSEKSRDEFVVTGKIGLLSKEKVIYKSISNPPLFSGANLKLFLKQRGVELTGKVRTGRTPSKAKILAQLEGDSLATIVNSMNKFSNNYIAEMLTKGLSANKSGTPGTLNGGLKRIREFLENDIGLKGQEFTLASPSGLSRKNRFTPKQFTEVLHWIQHQSRLLPEFLQSLPIAGVDGTLKDRMKGTPAETWVRAKTGLLSGAVALAGFANRPTGETFLFAFIHNGNPGGEGRVKDLFDNLATRIVAP